MRGDNADATIKHKLEEVLPSIAVDPAAPLSRRGVNGAIVGAAAVVIGLVAGGFLLLGGSSGESSHLQIAQQPSPTPRAVDTFPAALYPTPTSSPAWGFESGCADTAGVQRAGTSGGTAAPAAVAAVRQLDEGKQAALRASDRAFWPTVTSAYETQGLPKVGSRPTVVASGQRAFFRDLIVNHCGAAILADSLVVHVCPEGTRICTLKTGGALADDYLVVERQHKSLVWFMWA